MTEMEKCRSGQNYNCHDKIFLELKRNARELLTRYNGLSYCQNTEKCEVLQQLFGSNVSVNMNCTFVDCNKINIGNNVLIASNVQLYTAAHPVELSERVIEDWHPENGTYFCQTYALPITIEDGCWLGGGVIVLPGVTIGSGTVIGAGSVVTKDIPANCTAAGNPCRVIRRINGDK